MIIDSSPAKSIYSDFQLLIKKINFNFLPAIARPIVSFKVCMLIVFKVSLLR